MGADNVPLPLVIKEACDPEFGAEDWEAEAVLGALGLLPQGVRVDGISPLFWKRKTLYGTERSKHFVLAPSVTG